MSLIAHSLVTKGILGESLGTKGFILISLEQDDIPISDGIFFSPNSTQYNAPKDAKKWIKVKFNYDEKTWEQTLLIDNDVKVEMQNIKID